MKKFAVLLMILSVMVFAVAGCADNTKDNGGENLQEALPYAGQTLLVNSGAGLNKAVDAVAKAFEEQSGATVNMNYAGCAQLLGQMEINQTGDVFVGGSLQDMDTAMEKGFTTEYFEVAYHIPAIAVPAANPANIASLADMAKPGVKLILGDKEANAIGKKGQKIFEKNGLAEAIEANVVARDATVNEIVTQIAMGQGDAGLVWSDNGFENDDIKIIEIPEDQNLIEKVPVCVLKFTANQELAQAFVDFMVSDAGKTIFADHGFKVIE